MTALIIVSLVPVESAMELWISRLSDDTCFALAENEGYVAGDGVAFICKLW